MAWKHGGLADGERTQFRDLLDQLTTTALVVADADFVVGAANLLSPSEPVVATARPRAYKC